MRSEADRRTGLNFFTKNKTASLHGLKDGTIILAGGGRAWQMKIKKTLTQC